MPKLTEATRQKRKRHILEAARRCFTHKGFHATSIADICTEAGVSAGAIYTWFENKHALVAALASKVTNAPLPEFSTEFLHSRFVALQSVHGLEEARLDLTLWAEATRDRELDEIVRGSMNDWRERLERFVEKRTTLGDELGSNTGAAGLLEAIVLGLEVQRALERPGADETGAALRALLGGNGQ